jgi:HPt (histidine-containing phosphotransfer) domain-containing protein
MSQPIPPPVDSAALDELRAIPADGGRTLLDEMVELFAEDNARRVAALEAALAAGDALEAAELAHSLKGSCSNFGADELERRCKAIELAARADDLARARAELPGALAEAARVLAALEAAVSAT